MVITGFYQVYHIAKCKQENDSRLKHLPLKEMCRNVMEQADKMCVAIVRHWYIMK